jgi:hypothetical protein
MEEALEADGNPIPEGSTVFERHPLELPSTDAPPEATDPVTAASPGEPPALT